jgi:tetratricopeptide (TPR) repeat protein
LVLRAKIIDVESGDIKGSPEVQGDDKNIYSLVDSMSLKLRMLLLPQDRESEKYDPPIREVTTKSTEAHRYYLKGEELAAKYDFLESIEAFKKAVTLDTAFATAYSRMAWVYHFINQEEEATKAIESAFRNMEHLKEREKFYVRFERARGQSGWEEARDELMRWIERFPDDKLARFELGYLYSHQFFLYDKAIYQFERAIDIDPAYGIAYNYLGYTYAHKGMKEESLEALYKYASLAPDPVNPYDSLGEIYMNLLGDYNKAEECFQKAYNLNPNYAPQKLAEVFQLKGMYWEAKTLVENIVTKKTVLPEYAKYFLLARLHFQKEEYAQAQNFIQIALSLEPEFPASHWLSGLIHLKLGRPEEVKHDLQSMLLKSDSDSAYSYHLMGMYSLSVGDRDGAIAALRKPLELIEYISTFYTYHREYFHQSLAEAYFKTGDLKTAEATCLEILDSNPNWAPVLFLMGQIYEKMGNSEKASGAYQRFLSVWQSADRDHPSVQEALNRIAHFKRG